MSNGDNAELYALIERLLQLRDAGHVFRWRIEQARREAIEYERRYHEEEEKIRQEFAATIKAIRQKLGVPEPPSSESDKPFSFGKLFEDFFEQLGMHPNKNPLS